MLTQDQINNLPMRMTYRLEKLNSDVLSDLGRRVKDIGQLLPSDASKLEAMRRSGADVSDITRELANITGKNTKDIYAIYNAVASDNAAFAKTFLGTKYVPYEKNSYMQHKVNALARQTADSYINMSQTTGFMITDGAGTRVFSSLSKTYQEVTDRAIVSVISGAENYQFEMRKILIELADSGLRTVDYASGYSRRLDTSVRQNVLYGIKQCNQTISDIVGEEIGADGFEISYHRNSRPSHMEMGGKQYAKGAARTINGVYYPSFFEVEGLLQDYNCLHFKYPVVLGISRSAYSDEELAELKENDNRTFDFEGKTYTGYEAQQQQRKLESAMRNAKDRQTIALAAGDTELALKEQLRINQLADKYKRFSDKAGLSVKADRIKTSGYKRMNVPKSKTITPDFDITENGKYRVLTFDKCDDYERYIRSEYNAQKNDT